MQNYIGSLIEISGISRVLPEHANAFKQLNIDETVEIPSDNPPIGQLLHVNAGVKILGTSIISTPRAVSYEGQVMTGQSLIVRVQLEQKIEYVADNHDQSIHSVEFRSTFSTYIVLDDDSAYEPEIEVTPYIEDIHIIQIDKRVLFEGIILLLNAAPLKVYE